MLINGKEIDLDALLGESEELYNGIPIAEYQEMQLAASEYVYEEEQIDSFIQNEETEVPPLDDWEVQSVVRSVTKYKR